jgi:RNA polymerase sigma-70 factor, ECF subfamily
VSTSPLPQGSDASFEQLVSPHQPALLAHCYRMTGSLPDAEDALQETLVRAWRSLDSFEGRSSLRTWLFRIATNASLRVLEQRKRRVLPVDFGPAWDPHGPAEGPLEENLWITPFPDLPGDGSPHARYDQKESVELAFVASLQTLPGRQRAVLLLRDVLGFSSAETATVLDASVASVNSALNRARRTIESHDFTSPGGLRSDDPAARELVDRLVAAWVANDVDALVALLAADVEMTMPPMAKWFRGREDVASFLRSAPLDGRLEWRALDLAANHHPGFALYARQGAGWLPHSLNVLTLHGDRLTRFDAFLSPRLFPSFGLPARL